MARKEGIDARTRGAHEIMGILLLSLAVLTLVALFSYDRLDLDATQVPANDPKRNWIGPFGAWTAYGLLFAFGGAAFMLPVFFLGFGLAFFFDSMAYLRRHSVWPWTLVLLLSTSALLHIYADQLAPLKQNLGTGMTGGLAGMVADNTLFKFFGRVGAPILLATLYLVSLLFLTNLQLFEWLHTAWQHRPKAPPLPGPAAAPTPTPTSATTATAHPPSPASSPTPDRATRKASEPTPTPTAVPVPAGIGPDLRPVPEPTVRDLSVPQSKLPRPADKPKRDTAEPVAPPPSVERKTPAKEAPVLEGEVIPAREVAAATKADILGGARTSTPTPTPAPVADSERSTKPTAPASGAQEPADDPSLAAPVSVAASADKEAVKLPAAPAAPVPELPAKPRLTPRKPKPVAVAATPLIGNYKLPPLDFLHHPDPNIKPTETKEELVANARLMQQTLAQFGIEVALGDITKGPTITRYELHPAPGVKLEKISSLSNNIAAALKAERIHILAPVPGKSSVGVEVPNAVKTKVIIRDLLESEEWTRSKARIPLALGKDVYGHPIVADLADMPHLLIAGSTGSGKSVCINAIIASLLYRFAPDELRFVMIDPKVVELQQYNSLPHLVVPVVNDPKKVILALRWVVNEMEKRYQIFARVGVRNIKSFNERPKDKPAPSAQPELPLTAKREKIEAGSDGFAVEVDEEIVVPRDEDIVIPDKLSYIVVIIDELADLMLVAPADVEMAIARITQMARAAGIHCIVATQRPSVDVITGVIKANIPARIAFQVAAKVDSRTILDAMGADKLLGKGDMLYLPPGSAKLTRAQGVLITDQEIQNVVDFINNQSKPSYEIEIHQQLSKPASSYDPDGGGGDTDEDLIDQCIEVIRSEQKASVSLLQRRLRLGYTRAARIMDELENRGIVGPSRGAEPRDILVDLDGGGADGRGQGLS